MRKFVCTVCGDIYDESKGIPDAGIPAGTKWEELPEEWTCPLCGAAKSEFKEAGAEKPAAKKPLAAMEKQPDLKELSALEMSALCSNLSRGCEKQYKEEEAALFTELAEYFKSAAVPEKEADIKKLIALINKDLEENLPLANAAASDSKDRGAMRALVWNEKVTRILKSLLSRYEKEGEAILESTGVYVCTICGFIYLGDTLPEICPVCKVPNWKFEKIEGRAL